MQSLILALDSADESALATSPLEALLEASGDVTLHLNEQGQATFTSRAAQSWSGDSAFTVGGLFFDLFDAALKDGVRNAFNQVLLQGKVVEFSAPLQAGVGRTLAWKLCRYAVGQKKGVLAVAQDTTVRHELELKLQQATKYDGLTNLPNRATAQELCTQLQTEARPNDKALVFHLLNVSGLTRINNAFGSERGDQVLVQLVQRLHQFLGGAGRVVRAGSTEFGIFLRSDQKKEELIRNCRQLVTVLEAPYFLGADSAHLQVRIGITSSVDRLSPFDAFYAASAKALTKAREFSQVAYLDIDRGGIPESKEFMKFEAALHEGVRNGELYLVYQPLYSDSGLYGVEALMRWKQANGVEVSPLTFIPVAESNGLIQMLGEWALRRASFEVAALNKLKGLALQVSVNVSPVQFLNPGFSRSVAATLASSGLAPHLLQLEITEGTLMTSPDVVEPILSALTSKGINIAVDDFGTGYSSLAYLKRFALSTLKIDRSFVKDLPYVEADMAVCGAISELSQKLGLKLVAEGIETAEQLACLKKIAKCSGYQGYFFGKPAPLNALMTDRA